MPNREHEESAMRAEALLGTIPGGLAAVHGLLDDRGEGLESLANPFGLEAIIRTHGRPPMLIRNNSVVWEPVPLMPDLTEAHVRRVDAFIPSVGRVEFINYDMRWGGTGFVVEMGAGGVRRVVTNRHVAKLVAKRAASGEGVFMRSSIGARYGAKLDMREEMDSPKDDAFELPVTKIVYLADDMEADVALLEITVKPGVTPDPLPLADLAVKDQEMVATIGYPAFDSRNDVNAMRDYFKDLYDVKRFAPGLAMVGGSGEVLSHDCTTLGGNSGSCLISLVQQKVVGLHFSGEAGKSNAAVSVPTLKALLAGKIIGMGAPRAPATPGAEGTGKDEERADGEHTAADLKDRGGYVPTFLGDGLEAPWPSFDKSIADDLARPSDATPERPYELRYTHFGVLFSKARRSPRVTAVNIDGEHTVRVKRTEAGSDKWYRDLRIARELQLGSRDFGKEIDRGHMVRREDPNWGPDAMQANFDTFHYTNAALQHSLLNQGKTLWQGLENYILDNARAIGFRACVFTGPVFRDDDERTDKDSAPVPLEFWKIVAMAKEGGGLHATAYLLSQGDLIRDLIERKNRVEAVEGFQLGAYRTFQIAVAHIEEATGLQFPKLRSADALGREVGQEAVQAGTAYRPLETLEDIIL